MLAAGAEGFGIKTWFEHRFFFKTLSVHPAVNGHPALFRVEEVKRGEKEEWCPHSSYTVVWYKLAS